MIHKRPRNWPAAILKATSGRAPSAHHSEAEARSLPEHTSFVLKDGSDTGTTTLCNDYATTHRIRREHKKRATKHGCQKFALVIVPFPAEQLT